MSKRVRGPVRTHRRPGARPPSERSAARRREILEQPNQLEIAEEVAQDVVEHRPAAAANELERAVRPTVRVHHKIKAGSVLAARAATEYVYVSQDMRRIVVVASGLVALLFTLWLLLVVMKVIPLPFY
ncbi:MAG: hypothetical protein ABIP53_00005 [Candidatus Limnocylindrales bacterium]